MSVFAVSIDACLETDLARSVDKNGRRQHQRHLCTTNSGESDASNGNVVKPLCRLTTAHIGLYTSAYSDEGYCKKTSP